MDIVADTSALILLEKTKLLEKLMKNKCNFTISEEVEKEAIEVGKNKGYPDAFLLKEKCDGGLIKIKRVKDQVKVNKIMKDFKIEKGEAESVVLFLQEKSDLLATDDRLAITACRALAIPVSGCPALVIESYNKSIIEKEEAINMIKILAKDGRYKDYIIFQALQDISGGKK